MQSTPPPPGPELRQGPLGEGPLGPEATFWGRPTWAWAAMGAGELKLLGHCWPPVGGKQAGRC